LISVEDALDRVLSLVGPLGSEYVPLRQAAGRVLSQPLTAQRAQPPFPASAMDGYAIPTADPRPGHTFHVIGESAAGHGFGGCLKDGEAVRIFTGAPVPEGAKRVVIQEDVVRQGARVTLRDRIDHQTYIRPVGSDFAQGDVFDPSGPLRPANLALAAAMNHAELPVRRRPVVALIATGDELAMPGETPRHDQIIASNTFGLAAMIEAAGGRARVLPIARDTLLSLDAAFNLATGADLIVTIGGASVGDHDLVAAAAEARGLERSFYKVAMRPGKPLMAGRLHGTPIVGLPGNPVSSMVCGAIFVRPMLHVMQGLPAGPVLRHRSVLSAPLAANGPREHYMRGRRTASGVEAFESQDSAQLGILAAADVLIVQSPHDPGREIGAEVDIIPI